MEIRSPNTVLANALTDSIDLLKPRIALQQPKRIEFAVGTQINGIPHIGTYLVIAGAFTVAAKAAEVFNLPVSVKFGALENSPYDLVTSEDGRVYQRNFAHALPQSELDELIEANYLSYMRQLRSLTGVPFDWSTYQASQQRPAFRRIFLDALEEEDRLRWVVSPSHGQMRVRVPCPSCSYAEKYAQSTTIVDRSPESVTIRSLCYVHGWYESKITADGDDGVYLDLNTLLRNCVKEAEAAQKSDTLSVMVKGGDWVMSCSLVDMALGVLGYSAETVPARFFTPEILTPAGAKLSKSLIRAGDKSLDDVPSWVLNMGEFREAHQDYAERLVELMKLFLSHPRHAFRGYSYPELLRVMGL
jgi:hypothetical protein